MTRFRTLLPIATLSLTLSAAAPLVLSAQTEKNEKSKPLADDTTMQANKGKRGKPGWTPGVVTSIDLNAKSMKLKDAAGKEFTILVKGDAAKVQLGNLKVGDTIKVADGPKETKIMKDKEMLAYDPDLKPKSPKS
jgi:hypothetical protein